MKGQAAVCGVSRRRLIIKQLNKQEVKLLLAQGCAFFRYLSKVLGERQPSTLTPLFGLFQLASASQRKYFVVLQNLRYSQRAPSGRVLVFDLKGIGGSHRYVPYQASDGSPLQTSHSAESIYLSDDPPDSADPPPREALKGSGAAPSSKAKAAASQVRRSSAAGGEEVGEGGSRESSAALGWSGRESSLHATPSQGEGRRRRCLVGGAYFMRAIFCVRFLPSLAEPGYFSTGFGGDLARAQSPVLWDQNFREFSRGFPLTLQTAEHRWLMQALFFDAEFLLKLQVVDYSLLVVVDESARRVTLGLIDFFRRYTWDKQVETIGKSLAYMTSGVQPTVLSPADYQHRFLQTLSVFFAPATPCDASAISARLRAIGPPEDASSSFSEEAVDDFFKEDAAPPCEERLSSRADTDADCPEGNSTEQNGAAEVLHRIQEIAKRQLALDRAEGPF